MSDHNSDIASFADAATAFIAWVESPLDGGVEDIRKLRCLLADLHSMVLRLPDGFDNEAPDPEGREHGEWKKLLKRLQDLPFDHYREVYDPFKDEKPVMGSLADDVADIYFDLLEGLELFRAGLPDGAAWHWRYMFQLHWGEHLTGAQSAVHSWLTLVECEILP